MRVRVPHGRVRTSTVLLALVFLLTLATYLLVRPVPASVAATAGQAATSCPTIRPRARSTPPPTSPPPTSATPSPGRGRIPVGSPPATDSPSGSRPPTTGSPTPDRTG